MSNAARVFCAENRTRRTGLRNRLYELGHPAADAAGYVLTPNVNTLIEMTDMREAERSYEANLNVIKASKAMLNETIDVLR